MRLLLDTHVMLWAMSAPRRLPPAASRLIADKRNTVAVSVISLMEIAVKRTTGRRGAPQVTVAELAKLVERSGYELSALRLEHVLMLDDLGAWHGDPFDRLLVAQAAADGRRLLTHDEALRGYGDAVIVF